MFYAKLDKGILIKQLIDSIKELVSNKSTNIPWIY